MKRYLLFIILIGIFLIGCRYDHDENPSPDSGRITFKFLHYVDGQLLVRDSMMYVNAAGNQYEIDQLKYFISEVTLYKSDGTVKVIDDVKDIDYIDLDIPSTLTWDVEDNIPVGTYDSINFIFGITADKNISYMFVNPPEMYMAWPVPLGGGYHYMQMNGKWLDSISQVENFRFHMGIGQLYKSNVIAVDSIYAFVQNYFTVSLPSSSFTINKDQTRQIEIIMNIESWFETPHVYDFNYWGGDIMQNQPAMQAVKDNGHDVFTVGTIN